MGHNVEGAEKENQHWERWAKKRTFVRALEGTYSHLYKQLVDQPRVFSSKGRALEGRARTLRQERDLAPGGQHHASIESHIEAYAPMARARSTATISTARCSTC